MHERLSQESISTSTAFDMGPRFREYDEDPETPRYGHTMLLSTA